MLPLALGLALLVGALAWAAQVKTRSAASALGRLVGAMERSTKRVGLFSLLPALAATAWIIHVGIEPPVALIVGSVVAAGVFAIALSVLKMEGVLTEPESVALARVASNQPPPSTKAGRMIWALIGLVLLGIAAYALSIVA